MAMPNPVVVEVSTALSVAQYGGKHPAAKPWKGLGPGVFEIVSNLRTETFRAVYLIRLQHAVYDLHCFQKKSPSRKKSAKTDIELIERRLKVAVADHEARYAQVQKAQQ